MKPRAHRMLVATALLACAPPAYAQVPAAGDPALAQALFDDARALMEAGRPADACPKFAESYRLDAATGTLMGLALCHEAEGKTASAWAEFLGVLEASKKAGRADRARVASEHASRLEAHLSRLTIVVGDAERRQKGLEIRRDGIMLGVAAWQTAMPVDPGLHVVEVTAPGRRPWRTEVWVKPQDDATTVSIPPLADEPATPVAAVAGERAPEAPTIAETGPHPSGGPTFPWAALLVGGTGVVATGVGAIFGLRALSENSEATAHCSPSNCTDPGAAATSHDALRDANVANVCIGVGLVGLAAGAYLFLTSRTAPSNTKPQRASVMPSLGPGRSLLVVESTW